MPPTDRPPGKAREIAFTHGRAMFTLRLPPSADELIDEHAFAQDERLPYWADLWPSSRALARYLIDHPPASGEAVPSTVRAIELGCGAVGLGSLTLAHMGVNALATDYEQEAIDSVIENGRLNRLSDSVARLETRLVDWRDLPADLGRFHLVLAADVMYEQRHAIALADAVPALLEPDGRFILADPGRRYLPEFQSRMRQMKFAERDLSMIVELNDDKTKTPSRVRIIEFCRARAE